MSSYALMGRPATRLETMGFFDKLVCYSKCFRSKAGTFPVWVLFINLCDDTPVFLTETTYQESNVIQSMTPHTNVSSQESYQSIISCRISTIVLLTLLFQKNRPTDTIVPVGYSHINFLNPINIYISIRYNRIIYKLCLFPKSPKYPVSDHNISKIRLKM